MRENLEKECDGEFATCVVPEVSSTFLLVTTPDLGVLRKSLIACKDDLKEVENLLFKKKGKRGRPSKGITYYSRLELNKLRDEKLKIIKQ